MGQRATQLRTVATNQVDELIDLVSRADDAILHRPCPGREKLGDGSVAASAAHTADNYQRIGTFVGAGQRTSNHHGRLQLGMHQIPDALAIGHRMGDQNAHLPGGYSQQDAYTAETAQSTGIAQRLTAAREAVSRIGQLTDEQLDAIPAKGSFRFCDGKRTLELVLVGLLKHQEQQVLALKSALA
jgi:hypothetical protein